MLDGTLPLLTRAPKEYMPTVKVLAGIVKVALDVNSRPVESVKQGRDAPVLAFTKGAPVPSSIVAQDQVAEITPGWLSTSMVLRTFKLKTDEGAKLTAEAVILGTMGRRATFTDKTPELHPLGAREAMQTVTCRS